MRNFTKLSLVFLFTCAAAWAQVTAQIHGTVQDASGSAVPGAQVVATQTDTRLSRTVTSGTDGSFVLTNLPIGPYQVEVTKEGFTKSLQSGIVLDVNSDPAIAVALKIGAVNEQVTVEATTTQVETRDSTIGAVTTNQSILELPLNGRQATDLIVLSGAAVDNNGITGDVLGGRDVGGTPHLQIAGGSIFAVGYLLDGSNFANMQAVASLPMPFPDALEEFRVETSGISTTDARAAEISAVTKSGTNTFHGDLFEFLRNDATNARQFFSTTSSTLKRNQFGGTIGGPILKNRLFFFGGYQQTIIRSNPGSAVAFVPTPAMLAGNFTTFESPACNNGVQKNLRGGFVNNQASPAVFSKTGLNIAEMVTATTPTPNQCGLVTYGSPTHENTWQPIGRIDYQINDKHSLFGRYTAIDDKQPTGLAYSKDLLNTTVASSDDLVQSITLGETYLVNANTVNSFRLSADRIHANAVVPNFFSLCTAGANMYCGYDPANTFLNVIGGFSIGNGDQNISPLNPTGSNWYTNEFEAKDDLTIVRGSHQMSFGGSLALTRFWEDQTYFTAALTYMTGQFTGSGLGDLLMGDVGTMTQSGPFNYFVAKQWFPVLYATDTWKATRKLTVIAGVRWEPFLPPNFPGDTAHNFSLARFEAGTVSTVHPNAPAGWYYPGDPGFPGSSGSYDKWGHFSPRLGLAWDPKGDGKMSIRASYALSYAVVGSHWWEGPAQDAPLGATDIGLNGVSLDNPWANFPGGNPFPRTSATFPANAYYNSTPYNIETPYIGAWTLAAQRQIGNDWVVSATYLGSETVHEWYGDQLNPAVYVPGQCAAGQYGLTAAGACSTTSNENQRRALNLMNPQGLPMAEVDTLDTSGTGSYNGLLLAAQHRFSRNFNLQTNYTWSHCLDDSPVSTATGAASGGAAYNMLNDRTYDKGDCVADRRQIFNLTAVYQSPQFSQRALRILASGWQLAPIFEITSGAPLNVLAGSDVQLNGDYDQNGNIYERPNQVLSSPYGTDKGGYPQWLSPAAFSIPASGTFGDLQRNSVIGPKFWSFNMALSRQFQLRERSRLEVRAEAFNITNSFIPGNPTTSNLSVTSSQFGLLTQAYPPRIMQFAMKYIF